MYLLHFTRICMCWSKIISDRSSKGFGWIFLYAWAFIMPAMSLFSYLPTHKLLHTPHAVWPTPRTRRCCIAEQKTYIIKWRALLACAYLNLHSEYIWSKQVMLPVTVMALIWKQATSEKMIRNDNDERTGNKGHKRGTRRRGNVDKQNKPYNCVCVCAFVCLFEWVDKEEEGFWLWELI